MRKTLPILAGLLLGAGLLLTGACESFTSEPDPPTEFQTEILTILVEPNPVVVGDTARFTCIVEDSLDESFSFFWVLPGPSKLTEANYLDWKADVAPGRYQFGVAVDNGDPTRKSVNRQFEVTVVE